MDSPDGIYEVLAGAFVRGSLGQEAAGLDDASAVALGRRHQLKLHRFKRTSMLPRVRAVLGVLRGLAPQSLLDIGTGRGVFLWPLLDAFPDLSVTAVEAAANRRAYLEAVARGGVGRLSVSDADGSALPMESGSFDVVTVLEVLEHQHDPLPMAREAVRVAKGYVVATVPSKPDDNPEHVQLFTARSLETLLRDAGARNVRTDHVLNHIVAVVRVSPDGRWHGD